MAADDDPPFDGPDDPGDDPNDNGGPDDSTGDGDTTDDHTGDETGEETGGQTGDFDDHGRDWEGDSSITGGDATGRQNPADPEDQDEKSPASDDVDNATGNGTDTYEQILEKLRNGTLELPPYDYERMLADWASQRAADDAGASLRAGDPDAKSLDEMEAEAQRANDEALREAFEAAIEWGVEEIEEGAVGKVIETVLEKVVEWGPETIEFVSETGAGVIVGIFETTDTAPPELDEHPSAPAPSPSLENPGLITPLP